MTQQQTYVVGGPSGEAVFQMIEIMSQMEQWEQLNGQVAADSIQTVANASEGQFNAGWDEASATKWQTWMDAFASAASCVISLGSAAAMHISTSGLRAQSDEIGQKIEHLGTYQKPIQDQMIKDPQPALRVGEENAVANNPQRTSQQENAIAKMTSGKFNLDTGASQEELEAIPLMRGKSDANNVNEIGDAKKAVDSQMDTLTKEQNTIWSQISHKDNMINQISQGANGASNAVTGGVKGEFAKEAQQDDAIKNYFSAFFSITSSLSDSLKKQQVSLGEEINQLTNNIAAATRA